MNKIPTLTDKELKKWLDIIGKKRMQYLYIESKIYLTQKQLDYVIEQGQYEGTDK